MEKVVNEVKILNDFFESTYIYKSIVLCNEPSHMYHMMSMLKAEQFPIELLTHENFMTVLRKFHQGKLRMLMMSDLMFDLIQRQCQVLFRDVTYVFFTHKTFIPLEYYKSVPHLSEKFISLEI